MSTSDWRRLLPSVDAVLRDPRLGDLGCEREFLVRVIRDAIEYVRGHGEGREREELAQEVASLVSSYVAELEQGSRPVINATGIVLHTNLGRAPLSGAATTAMVDASGYSDLEYDLESGERSSRLRRVTRMLRWLTGAEDALCVNNNAAGILLALDSLARGSEAIVSRGELVEIGDSFRMPEVMSWGGVRLREVGTTNRTYPDDYRAAITDQTAILLKVHCSNFRVVGFAGTPGIPDLAVIGRERGIPVVYDMGSGQMIPGVGGSAGEPDLASALALGADVVTASGDKLLGGPQAGLILGRRDLVGKMRQNPLLRALRMDKVTLAALEATLLLYVKGRATEEVPTLRALATPATDLAGRANRLADQIRAVVGDAGTVELVRGVSAAGGGSLPGEDLPTTLVRLLMDGYDGRHLGAALRRARTPVVARIEDAGVAFDPRTVSEVDLATIALAVSQIRKGGPA